jgi:hypothetical protein
MKMEGLTRTSFLLPKDVLKQAKIRAIEEGISFAEVVRKALQEYLKESKKKGGK